MFCCVLLQFLISPSATSFVCYQIHFGNFLFGYTVVVVLVKEVRLVIVMDELDFKIKNVTFEAKVVATLTLGS
jgi:hypothetical protein